MYDSKFLFKEETYQLIGICMEVHNVFGHGFLEIVYKDAIEMEVKNKTIPYKREQEYKIIYKGLTLSHRFFADFVLYDKIILEVKAAEGGIANDQIAQTLNYLKASGCKVGLIVNFGKNSLEHKRLIL
jgi:GxxExxY protein